MSINIKSIIFAGLALGLGATSFADELHTSEHGDAIFHKVRLEAGAGEADGKGYGSFDLDAWIGTDQNKLWIKSEGQRTNSHTEKLNLWALYSRNIASFWDAQIGVRVDDDPKATSYLVAGFEGLAPYFFETEAHAFISKDGNLSFRLKQRNDFLITQRLIVQPYVEAALYAQSVKQSNIGAGLSQAEFGIQTRYEFTRKFAPYFDVKYERKFGETASFAKRANEDVDSFVAMIGLRMMF
ncbi:MAG: copper resistance protein B [Candidatus Methylopumilus sp.]